MWLPFALARVCQTICGAFGGDAPKTSEVLRSFLLPEMARAVEEDEKAEENDRLVTAFKSLAERFKANNGGSDIS